MIKYLFFKISMQSNKNEKRRPKQAEPVNKPQLRLLMLHGYRFEKK